MGEIVVEKVCKYFRDEHGKAFTALSNVSFRWREKENISFTGESGSGKSTLARLLIGLDPPSSGNIIIDGVTVNGWNYQQWKKQRKSIQAVFQDASGSLNRHLSVKSNLNEALINLDNLTKKEREKRIIDLMEVTGTNKKLLETPTKNLSGGEQRRVALLRALAVRPKYLILDELSSGLDILSQKAILDVLKAYHQEYHCSYLLITHDMRFAYALSNRIYELSEGKIINIGHSKADIQNRKEM